MLGEVDAKAAALAVFPELALSGYAIDDLLLQDTLHTAIAAAVERLVAASADLLPLIFVGAPLRYEGRLYNCALAIHRGQLLGVIPKVHLPNYREFYERRHFASGHGMSGEIVIGDRRAPFGPDLLFVAEDVPGLVIHAEICEDLWVPVPQSSLAALAGATVLANLSASNITIGKSETRQLLIKSQSQRCLAPIFIPRPGRANRRPISPGMAKQPSPKTVRSSPNRRVSLIMRNSCSPISILISLRRNAAAGHVRR